VAVKPLIELKEGQKAKVVELCSGWECRKRMAELGFDLGSEVRIVKKSASGPLIVELKGSGRLALGRGEAGKIIVEEK